MGQQAEDLATLPQVAQRQLSADPRVPQDAPAVQQPLQEGTWCNAWRTGLGDVKLAGVLGLAAGWFGWSTWTQALVAAFGLGAVVSLGLLAARRAQRRTVLPFGSFMLAGALLAVMHL